MSFTSGDDFNSIQGTDTSTISAYAGNDRYVLDPNLIAPNQKITISDTVGNNTLIFAAGLTIASSKTTADAMQLTLSNGAVVTLLGASTFSFKLGGNPSAPAEGVTQNFATFVTSSLGLAAVPIGTVPVDGNTNVVVNADGTTTGGGVPPETPPTFALSASADSVNEGVSNIFTVTASKAVTEDTVVTFQLKAGDVAAPKSGTTNTNMDDFGAGSFNAVTATILKGGTTATFSVAGITKDGTEMTEKYSVDAVVNGQTLTKTINLLDGEAGAGETFLLTKDQDIIAGTAGNDTVNGLVNLAASVADASTTFNGFDQINGAAGTNTFKLAVSGAMTGGTPYAASLANIEKIQVVEINNTATGDTVEVDASAVADLTDLKVTKSTSDIELTGSDAQNISVAGAVADIAVIGGKDVTVTNATATNNIAIGGGAGVADPAGAITVTSTKQAAGTIDIDGGTAVTVTTTSTLDNGAIVIGASKAATGAVSVTSNLNGDGTATLDQANITITGGSTVTVNSNLTITAKDQAASNAHTFGKVTVTGDSKTTSVTVNQTYAETEFTKAGTAVVKEADTVTFKAMTTGQTLIATVGGDVLTFKATTALIADQVATAFANLVMSDTQSAGGPTANGYYTGNFSSVWSTAVASGATVVFTAKTHTETNVTWTGTATAPTVVNAAGTALVADATSTNTSTFGVVIIDDNATAAIKTISVNGYGASSIGDTVAANALETLTLSNSANTMKVDSTSKTLALNVNNVTHAVNLDDTSADVTTLTINATGKASSFALTAEAVKDLVINADVAFTTVGTGIDGALKTVDINGAGAVNLGDIAAAALKTFNAADNTGGVTAEISAKTSVLDAAFTKYVFSEGSDTVTMKTVDVNKAIDLGAGKDTITLATGVRIGNITANIDGGADTNTLKLAADDAEVLSAANTFNAKIDKFQHLTIGNAASQEVVNLDNIDAISYVTLGAATGTKQVDDITPGGTIEVGDIFTVTVNGKAYSFTATTGTVANVVTGLQTLVDADAAVAAADNTTKLTVTSAAFGVPVDIQVAHTEGGGAATETITLLNTTLNAYGITLNNLANNGTVSLTDNATVLVNVKDAALVTSTTDVLNLQTQVNSKAFVVTANDVETIKVNTVDTYTAGVANKDATTLGVVADAATKVTVAGDGYLTLSTTAAVLTEVDAGKMTGQLTYTASLASLVVKGGLGVDSLTANANGVKLYGNGGGDKLTVNMGFDSVKLFGGAGNDTFEIKGGSTTNSTYTVIDTVNAGDVFKLSSGTAGTTAATSFKSTKVELSEGASVNTQALIEKALGDLSANQIGWFNYTDTGTGKDYTFLVLDGAGNASTTYQANDDVVVMLVGNYDLGTGASYNSSSNILEIA